MSYKRLTICSFDGSYEKDVSQDRSKEDERTLDYSTRHGNYKGIEECPLCGEKGLTQTYSQGTVYRHRARYIFPAIGKGEDEYERLKQYDMDVMSDYFTSDERYELRYPERDDRYVGGIAGVCVELTACIVGEGFPQRFEPYVDQEAIEEKAV